MRTSSLIPRLTVWLPAVTITLFAIIYVPLAGAVFSSTLMTKTASAAPTHSTGHPAEPVIASGTPTSTPTHTNTPAATTPQCTPAVFNPPNQMTLETTTTGLHIQNDTPTYYQIYGNTADVLRTQITQCAPGAGGGTAAEYTGDTAYSLTWQYNTIVTDTGCSLTNLQVGLHIATALPYWQPTPAASPGLSDRWQQFIQALATHEHGHAELDSNYAGLLQQQLTSLGVIDCTAVQSIVQTTVNTIVSELNDANNSYDAQTNHGATQGAILPTY